MFGLSEDQVDLIAASRTLALDKFKAKAMQWHRTSEYPAENIAALRDAGLLGLCAPKLVGGGGRSEFDALLVLDAIGSVCPTTAAAMNVFDVGPLSILTKHGSAAQQEKYIPRMLNGELRLSIALTEPDAGSELTGLKTSGRVDGSEVLLNGVKVFSSGANAADVFLVYVRFGPKLSDIGAVIVEKGSPGLVTGPTRTFMSGSTWAELRFEDCRVPIENILPLENGFKDLILTYNMERLGAVAKSLGIAECARTRAQEYVLSRHQFGGPLWDQQGLRWKFADMEMRIESARLLMMKAAANAVDGNPSRIESSMAKLAASEAASFVCDEAIQVCGGTGFDEESGLPWLYGLARSYRIAGGASELHRNMIAKDQLASSWTFNDQDHSEAGA